MAFAVSFDGVALGSLEAVVSTEAVVSLEQPATESSVVAIATTTIRVDLVAMDLLGSNDIE